MRLAFSSVQAVESYLEKSQTILFGHGSIENHGRHMPLGTDTLIPDKIIDLLEEKSDVLIAPTLPYGAADSLAAFTGTVSLGVIGLYDLLCRVCDSLYEHGFRKFVIVNGHGGNAKSLEMLGQRLYKKGAYLAVLNWWLMAGELRPEWAGGHGGAEETAGVMAVNPDLIVTEKLHDPLIMTADIAENMPSTGWDKVEFRGASVIIPRPVKVYNKNGWYGEDKPFEASEAWGREMVQTMADYIAEFLPEFEKVALPKP